MPLFVVRDDAELTDELGTRIKQRIREVMLASTRPQRDPRDRRGADNPVGQGARGPGQAHPDGHAARTGRQPRRAHQPRVTELLRGARPQLIAHPAHALAPAASAPRSARRQEESPCRRKTQQPPRPPPISNPNTASAFGDAGFSELDLSAQWRIYSCFGRASLADLDPPGFLSRAYSHATAIPVGATSTATPAPARGR